MTQPRRTPLLPAVEETSIGRELLPVLDEVERRLHAQVSSSRAFVEEAARYLMDAGGKRLRPTLVALCACLGEREAQPSRGWSDGDARIADAGVVVELVHLATLYHDDVIDEASARRGTASANTRWDNTVAILTGDYLFARASDLSADLGVEVTRIMARTIAALCEGQISEVQGSRGALPPDIPSLEPTLEHYLRVVSEKTASLIATSCRLGALLSDRSGAEIEAAAEYGWNLGMAFQLSDDVLDIASEHEQTGKTPGTDLREGVRTLPIIYAAEDEPGGELAQLIDADAIDDAAVARALELLRGSAALDRARETTATYATEAERALDVFDDGPAVRALRHLAKFTLVRTG